MNNFLTVAFVFCEKLYHSIIIIKKKGEYTIYQITVMNGELEKLLHGNHIITEINGCLNVEVSDNNKQEMLKAKIAEALSNLIRIPLKTIKKS